MALESASYISDLVSTNPTASDNISQGDDHIRLLKSTLKATFPNITGAVTPTHTKINDLATVTGSETLTNKSLTSPTLTGTVVLGAGNGTATVTSVALNGASATGTNLAGTDLVFKAGNGTGTGGSGVITFQTAAAGSTGTTANTLTERMRIDNAGNVGIGTTTPYALLNVGTRVLQAESITGMVAHISGVNSDVQSSGNLNVNSTSAQAADIGGSIGFGGYYNSVSGGVSFAQIAGRKENSTDGNTAGYLQFSTRNNGGNTTERMRIDSSGNVGIGTSSPNQKLTVYDTTAAAVNVVSGNTFLQLIQNSANAFGPALYLTKTRGSVGAATAVASGDVLSAINFQGYGGTNFRNLTQISGYVDTYTSDTNISSYLTFNTSPSGSASPTERTRIDQAGYTYETNAVNTQSTAATLTAAQVLGGVIVTSPTGAINLTMPTGTDLDAAFPNVTGMTRDFSVVNTTVNKSTLVANTGVTLTGGMGVDNATPGLFRLRRTGSATYTCYRIG